MRTMSAKEAETRFGELLMAAQQAPVTIEENGRPVAVVYSMEWHEAAEKAKLDWPKRAVAGGVAEADRGELLELTDELMEQIKRCGQSPLDDSR